MWKPAQHFKERNRVLLNREFQFRGNLFIQKMTFSNRGSICTQRRHRHKSPSMPSITPTNAQQNASHAHPDPIKKHRQCSFYEADTASTLFRNSLTLPTSFSGSLSSAVSNCPTMLSTLSSGTFVDSETTFLYLPSRAVSRAFSD
jgi:hypothetical protein